MGENCNASNAFSLAHGNQAYGYMDGSYNLSSVPTGTKGDNQYTVVGLMATIPANTTTAQSFQQYNSTLPTLPGFTGSGTRALGRIEFISNTGTGGYYIFNMEYGTSLSPHYKFYTIPTTISPSMLPSGYSVGYSNDNNGINITITNSNGSSSVETFAATMHLTIIKS